MLGPCSDYFVAADKMKHKEHTRTMVEEAHNYTAGTDRTRTSADAVEA